MTDMGTSGGAGPSDHYGGPRQPQLPGTGQPHDPFEPPERSGLARGVVIVVVALVIGILLLPSATRAPRKVFATAASSSHGSSPASGHPGRSSTTTTTAPVPATIHVLVANATTVNGVAGSVTTFLAGKSFAMLTATNALTKLTASAIYYTSAGSVAEAGEVAAVLGLTSASIQAASANPPVSSTAGADVVVIAGQDLSTRFAPATTTTTA